MTRNTMTTKEVLVWMLLSVAALSGYLVLNHGPVWYNDGFQYVNVARNILAGHGAATSILHFDAEYNKMQLPAPMTTFPPGYPLVTAAFSLMGVELEYAAVLVSGLSLLFLIPVFIACARDLGIPPNGVRLMLCLFLTNQYVSQFSVSILTEQLFMVLALTAMWLFIRTEIKGPEWHYRGSLLLTAGLLVGLSCWVRYSGLFVLVFVIGFYGLSMIVNRSKRAVQSFLRVAVCLPVAGLCLARNIALAGTWKGGNEKVAINSVTATVWKFVISLSRLLFFGEDPYRSRINLVFIGTGIIIVLIVVIYTLATDKYRWKSILHDSPGAMLFGLVASYAVMMVYAGITTMISFGTRMFYPLLPELLLLLALVITRLVPDSSSLKWRSLSLVGIAAICASSLWLNANSLIVKPLYANYKQLITERFDEPTREGVPLATVLDRIIPRNSVIAAIDGQAMGYVLNRPTLSLVEKHFSTIDWTEVRVYETMRFYGAQYFLAFKGDAKDKQPSVLRESPFLAGLAEGRAPAWLKLLTSNSRILVYRLSGG